MMPLSVTSLYWGNKMKVLYVIFLAAVAFGADVIDPQTCSSFPCLIFEDTFDFLDHDVWQHEITLAGGGNWEFQAYINNRSTSYTRDGTLFIKPALTSEWQSEEFLSTGTFDLWGTFGKNDGCSGNWFYGCERLGTATNIVNPVLSGRMKTTQDFAFKYGRIEVTAKMPRGDWLWPAVWLLPQYAWYGGWPASGEIDILESRGNDNYGSIGNDYASSTMHWGPYFELNRYYLTQAADYVTSSGESFADGFHTWALEWTASDMNFYLDDELKLTVDPVTNFFDFGDMASAGDIDNPWSEGDKMAPFDQKFYLVVNLAVGGTNGFFPDEVTSDPAKPWTNDSPQALLDFWNGRDLWLPTWQQGESKISEGAALQVDSIRVYKMSADQI